MKRFYIALIVLFLGLPLFSQHCGNCEASNTKTNVSKKDKPALVLRAKKRHDINSEYYLVYSWQKKPKIGMAVLFVDIYRKKDSKRSDDFTVTANAYMPSMRGSHDTGDRVMKLNKKKSHVIDVNFMMLGDWEIEIKVNSGNSPLGKAYIRLNI